MRSPKFIIGSRPPRHSATAPLGWSSTSTRPIPDFALATEWPVLWRNAPSHAEYLAMPDLLLASVPDEAENHQAAYTTICIRRRSAVDPAAFLLPHSPAAAS